MEAIYAALILHRMNKEITEENIIKILDSVEIGYDELDVKKIIIALAGTDIDTIIKEHAQVFVPQEIEEPEEEIVEDKDDDDEEDPIGLTKLFG